MRSRPRLSKKVVFTVDAPRADFWRGETFDRWDGQTWTRSTHAAEQLARAGDTTPLVLDPFDDSAHRGEPMRQTFRIEASFSDVVFAAPSPVSRPVVRPLLATTRQETEAFCRALRLRPRRDPMNEDPRFMRVALRRAIPDLERALGRGIRESLARSAALLRQDADFLDELAAFAGGAVVRRDGDDVLLVADRLARLAPALSSRIVRRVLFSLRLTPEATHVQAVLSLASGRPGKRRQLPGGLLVRRDKGYVRLSPPSPERSRARRRPSADPREG